MFSLLAATYLTGIAIALTMGSSIAFVIHSVDRSFDSRWGLGARGFGVSIHLTPHLHGFLSRSLFSRLIAIRSLDPTLGLLEAGAQCAPYKLYFSNRLLAPVEDRVNKKRASIRRDTAVRYPPGWKSTITLDVGNLGVLLCSMRKLS